MEVQESKSTIKAQGSVSSSAEEEIRQFFDGYIAAFRSAELDQVLSYYADDVVAFDLAPPLQFVGTTAYRKSWEAAAQMMQAPWVYEPRDLKVYASDQVAFSHCLAEIGGTTKEGKREAAWFRHTIGYCKINGNWLIVHEQISAPVDMQTGQSMMNLSPDQEATH